MKTLADALQNVGNPLLEFRRLTAPKPIANVGVVAVTACPPKAAKNANYKPRRGRFQRYLEEWAPNVDGSLFADAHDAVAGLRRNDLDAVEKTSRMVAIGASDFRDMEDAAHGNRRPPSLSKVEKFLREDQPAPAAEHEAAQPKTPARSKRDLLMKTSRRQRLIMRAFRLTQQGMAWDDLARALGITQAEARSMRRLVVGLIGATAVRKPNNQPRDPETKQFVGCNTARPQSPKWLKRQVLPRRRSISATPTAQ